MASEELAARVLYLEKVLNQSILPRIMSKDKQKSKGTEGGDQAAGKSSAQVNSERSFQLVNPKYMVPTPGGLREVTAEVLDDDPALLKHMIDTYPECFVHM